jgi:hypothetical protein
VNPRENGRFYEKSGIFLLSALFRCFPQRNPKDISFPSEKWKTVFANQKMRGISGFRTAGFG